MKKVISILIAVLMVILVAVAFSACGKSDKQTETAYAGMENVQSMIDYAQRLEAAGNTEAAAQVWALIPDAAENAAKEDAKAAAEDTPEMQAAEAFNEADELASAMQGKGE